MAVARHAAERIAKSTVVDLKLPKSCDDITQVQTRIMLSEMSRSFLFERTHYPKKLSLILSKQLTDDAAISYEQYAKDLLFAGNAKSSIDALFNDEVDLLIVPSDKGEAPDFKDGTGDPVFCREWTLLGLPCININVASGPNGLPVGVQLIAGPGKDHFLLSAARSFVHALPDPTLRDQA